MTDPILVEARRVVGQLCATCPVQRALACLTSDTPTPPTPARATRRRPRPRQQTPPPAPVTTARGRGGGGSVQAAVRAALSRRSDGATATQLVRLTGKPMTSVWAALQALRRDGSVTKDKRLYRLGASHPPSSAKPALEPVWTGKKDDPPLSSHGRGV